MGKPNIVITMGDPSGVGPEVTLKSLASPKIKGLANFLLIGDTSVVEKLKADMGLRLKVPFLDLSCIGQRGFSYGRCEPSFGCASIKYLDKALELLKAGKADALVTAPINKTSVRLAGYPGFEGHTEYLAEKTHTKDCAMMFVGERLKITLVTRHIALKAVPSKLTSEAVYRSIAITHKYLKKYFRIANPKIAVAGLNPHAGENGAFGDEEAEVIIPAVKKAMRTMKGVCGPFPSDAVFYAALKGRYDSVIAMYHDQALAPFKLLYFDNGVNLTLGLPFVRTSPDHGTAFDIAGKGVANPESMIEAIRLACELAGR